jgi:phosphotransferase system  glucose/maltose/N-acetylglucosamine-specific IIC component
MMLYAVGFFFFLITALTIFIYIVNMQLETLERKEKNRESSLYEHLGTLAGRKNVLLRKEF